MAKNKSSLTVGASAKKLKVPTETFAADGTVYQFNTSKFIFKGQEISAEKALKDDELLAELVDMKAGVITAVGEVEPDKNEEGGE